MKTIRTWALISIVTVASVVLFAGQSSALTQAAAAQIRAVADPIMDNILSALAKGDYQAYLKDMDANMVNLQPRPVFDQSRRLLEERIGRFVSKEFVSVTEVDRFYVVQYSGFFTRAKEQVSIRLVLVKTDKGHRVAGLWFDSPSLRQP